MVKKMTTIGIDYSITSPGVFFDKTCHSLSGTKSLQGVYRDGDYTFYIHEYPLWATEEERHIKLAQWVMDCIKGCDSPCVSLEGYAFGASVGRVFNLSENTGELKKTLYRANIPFETVAPPALKKYATGKGNANKEAMYQAWIDAGMPDLMKLFGKPESKKLYGPITDIVDAYWLMMYGNHPPD